MPALSTLPSSSFAVYPHNPSGVNRVIYTKDKHDTMQTQHYEYLYAPEVPSYHYE